MLSFNGQNWIDCWSKNFLTGGQQPVIVAGHLGKFVETEFGFVHLPPHVCILQMPQTLKNKLLADGIIEEVLESKCVTGHVWNHS